MSTTTTQPTTAPAAPSIRARRRFGIIADSTRRAGLRVVIVSELERLEGLAASYVMQTRRPTERHYLPWARLAASVPAAREKIRALLPRPTSALARAA